MPRAKTPALTAGRYYWIALDDGQTFEPIKGFPAGPHLGRLDLADGEWTLTLCGRQGGILEIGPDPRKRIVRGSWARNSFLGTLAYDTQDVRITWLSCLVPPALPDEVEPDTAVLQPV